MTKPVSVTPGTVRKPYAFECPGGKWNAVQSDDQRLCPNCGRAIVIHRVVIGELAEQALGLRPR